MTASTAVVFSIAWLGRAPASSTPCLAESCGASHSTTATTAPWGSGWFSFDQRGVHFVGLVNVLDLKAGGLGSLGQEQLEWLEDDVKSLSATRRSWCLPTCPCGPSTPTSLHPRRTGKVVVREG